MMNENTQYIFDQLKTGQFSLSLVSFFNKKNTALFARTEFNRCNDIFKTRFALRSDLTAMEYQGAIMELMQFISVKELPHMAALEKLAIETIANLYDVPEDVIAFKAELGGDLSVNNKHVNVNLSPSAKEKLLPEIQKRILLNGLAHGSSIHIWKTIHHMVKEQINALGENEKLFTLYEKYTDLVGIYIWKYLNVERALRSLKQLDETNNAGATITQGFEFTDFSGDVPEINARAINFPVLLHELNKGVVDFLITKGINPDLTKEELEYVLDEADKYEHELWHQILSPSIWVSILKNNKNSLAEEISRLSQMDYEDLKNYLNKITDEE